MIIIATCGHDVTDEWEMVCSGASWMDYARTGERAVSFGILCPECKELYESWGIILHNKQEEDDWLSGKTDDPMEEDEEP
jgi:hypothetical protein